LQAPTPAPAPAPTPAPKPANDDTNKCNKKWDDLQANLKKRADNAKIFLTKQTNLKTTCASTKKTLRRLMLKKRKLQAPTPAPAPAPAPAPKPDTGDDTIKCENESYDALRGEWYMCVSLSILLKSLVAGAAAIFAFVN